MLSYNPKYVVESRLVDHRDKVFTRHTHLYYTLLSLLFSWALQRSTFNNRPLKRSVSSVSISFFSSSPRLPSSCHPKSSRWFWPVPSVQDERHLPPQSHKQKQTRRRLLPSRQSSTPSSYGLRVALSPWSYMILNCSPSYVHFNSLLLLRGERCFRSDLGSKTCFESLPEWDPP